MSSGAMEAVGRRVREAVGEAVAAVSSLHANRGLAWWLMAAPVAMSVGVVVVRAVRRHRTRIIAGSEAAAALADACPGLAEYTPTPWLLTGHASTVFASLWRSSPGLEYCRVLLPLADGGTVAVDWHSPPLPRQPVAIIQHGLTGGSEERYVQWMVKALTERLGICCVVMNARGCSNTALLTPRVFCAADTTDYAATVAYVRGVVGPDTPLFGIGESLGAGILTKYVAEEGAACPLTAAIALAASYDFQRSSRLLESPLGLRTYNMRLTASLTGFMARHAHQFVDAPWLDMRKVLRAKLLRDFDTATVVPMYGFADVDAYYAAASTAHLLPRVAIPMLLINAADDPICAVDGLPLASVTANPNLLAVITAEGGHVAWPAGWWPRSESWDNGVVVEYVAAVLRQRGYAWSHADALALAATGVRTADIRPPAMASITAGVAAAAAAAAAASTPVATSTSPGGGAAAAAAAAAAPPPRLRTVRGVACDASGVEPLSGAAAATAAAGITVVSADGEAAARRSHFPLHFSA